MPETILSLCDKSHVWGSQYEPDFNVVYLDLEGDGVDVRLFHWLEVRRVRGIIAQPPCNHLAQSGSHAWDRKGTSSLLEAMSIVDACLRMVAVYSPAWWVLENPVGRLHRFLGPATATYNPCDYGEDYTKRTCLWGHFTMPNKNPVPALAGSKIYKMPDSKGRAERRALTPESFAEAFRLVNI